MVKTITRTAQAIIVIWVIGRSVEAGIRRAVIELVSRRDNRILL